MLRNVVQNGTAQQCLHIIADIKFCPFSVKRQIVVAKTDSMKHVEPTRRVTLM